VQENIQSWATRLSNASSKEGEPLGVVGMLALSVDAQFFD
jgi:hypothetical protein